MKVSCQSCGAQYNLPDDKVRGRKAKVRCKKCSAQIIVDGTIPSFADAEDDEATRVMMSPAMSASGEPMWTVNLSDEEQLDMTEPEVLAGWRDGRVTEDAYVWREGMDEWLPILESALAPAIRAAGPKAPEPTAPTPVAAPAREIASAPATGLGSSPLAAPAPKVASAPLASPAPPPAAEPSSPQVSRGSVPSPKPKAQRSDDTSKAFSFALGSGSSSAKKASRPPGSAAAGVGGLFGAPPAAAAPSAAASASAASSENSVMFSLDALKAAAAVEPKRASVRATAVSDARANEDILTLGAPSRFDDHAMPLIDIEVPPPAPRYDAPVAAAPLALPQKKKSPWLLIVGALVAVAGMGGAYVLGQQGKDEPAPIAANDSTDTVAGTRQGSTADQVNAAATTGEQPVAAASASAAPAAATNTPIASTTTGGTKPLGGTGGTKPVGDKTPDKPVETGKPDKPTQPTPPPASKPSGPAFNVGAAKSALASAAAGAAGCRAPSGPNGTGKVQVTFAPSGNVTSALIVSGPFGGTPVGSCVARTFRAAKVPAFDGSPMTVSKSFTIN